MKKIAFPTDDGETISRHLGEAPYYMVALLDDSGNFTFERRAKPHHNHHREEPAGDHDHARRGPAMFEPILDCQILISGGMGRPAYEHATAQGLDVLLPAYKNITDALQAYRTGTLVSDMRRVHKH